MSYFEALKEVYSHTNNRDVRNKLLMPIARYGDMMIVDDFASLVGIDLDPVALTALADLGDIKLNNVIDKNRDGGV